MSDAPETDLMGGRLGVAIRTIRISKGLSLDELALSSASSKGRLSGIENGQDNLTVSTLCRIARALDTKPGLLLEAAMKS